MPPFSALKSYLLDLLFPKICFGCGTEGSFLCSACRGTLMASAPTCPVCSKRNFTGILCAACAEKTSLRRFLAPFSYRNELVRDLIHAYKYAGVRELGMLFANEITSFLTVYRIRHRGMVLVPIPLHRSRERERGFNQALVLAQALGTNLQLQVFEPLERKRPTEQQIDMGSYEKRRENVANAFGLTDPASVKGKSFILVDDVSTSGATLAEAARVLRGAGARTVWAIAIAKG